MSTRRAFSIRRTSRCSRSRTDPTWSLSLFSTSVAWRRSSVSNRGAAIFGETARFALAERHFFFGEAVAYAIFCFVSLLLRLECVLIPSNQHLPCPDRQCSHESIPASDSRRRRPPLPDRHPISDRAGRSAGLLLPIAPTPLRCTGKSIPEKSSRAISSIIFSRFSKIR